MKKLKSFFYILYKSVTSIGYYADVITSRFSLSFKYYLTLSLLLSLILTTHFASFFSRGFIEMANNTIDSIYSVFPNDFELTVEDNVWSINKEEPFFIEMPKLYDLENFLPKHLIVFNKEGTINDLIDTDSLVMLNDKNVIIQDPSNKNLEIQSLENLPNGKIDIYFLENILETMRSYIKYVPYFVTGFIFIGWFLYFFIFRMVYLLLIALIMMLVGYIDNNNFGFKKYYQLALHTITIPIIIDTGLFIAGGAIARPPYWFILLNIGISMVVVLSLKNVRRSEVAENVDIEK